jgi:uncharacterized protein (TIGR00369 family)
VSTTGATGRGKLAGLNDPGATLEKAIWEEPPRGSAADFSLLRLPGLEQIRTFVDGRSPEAPIARLTGRRAIEADYGRVVYSLPVSDWLVGPKGTLHPGMIAFLADAPLLAAVQSTLPPGMICTTAEVSTTFLGPVSRGDELRAEARMIHADGATGLSEATITRSDGRLVGHATSRVFVFPPVELDDAGPVPTAEEEPEYDEPDPYLRPVAGGTLTSLGLSELSGLELLQLQIAGTLPRPPVDLLTGMRIVAAEDGKTEFALRTHGWCTNETGTLFGGMIALLATSSGSAAVQTIAPAGTAFKALDMKLNVIRPVTPDGTDLTALSVVIHRGRQLAIAVTEVIDSHGKRVAVATGTTMIGPAAEAEQDPAGVPYESA